MLTLQKENKYMKNSTNGERKDTQRTLWVITSVTFSHNTKLTDL